MTTHDPKQTSLDWIFIPDHLDESRKPASSAAAPVDLWSGLWMRRRIPGRAFHGVCYALLFVTGVKLGWDGVAGVFG